MDRAVISENLVELIAGRKVLAALFTTYTFEPDFFELEVIPLLLAQDIAYSADDRVKCFMVRENLREANLRIDVYYDQPMFRASGQCSPDMEYGCSGVNLGNRAFHGKINLLLVEDGETNERSLLVGAGSNNLTRAGWWDNIECQHWEEIVSGQVQRKFINVVKEDLDLLMGYRAFISPDKNTAIDLINDYIDTCKGSRSAEAINYFALSFPENRRSFIDFLQLQPSPLTEYNNWHLEIISPFFAEDAKNAEHQAFLDMGVVDIQLLLPFDSECKALCQDSYYTHIQKTEGVRWARWREDVARPLGLTGDYYRPLHAKVYHFYNGKQSWVFVGSVNFTHKALHDNVEAGFLVRLNKPGPFLEPFSDSAQIDEFANLNEVAPGDLGQGEEGCELPAIHLCYDWLNRRLVGRTTSPRKQYEIEILGPEGDPAIDPWVIRYQESHYDGDIEQLENALRTGSLVKVRGFNLGLKEKAAFPGHSVLLQQIGWSHKPLELPDLTATQILAIYAGMSHERRQLMMMDAKIRSLVLSSQGGELTAHLDDQVIDQFFCEYAEIFNAFSKLKARLSQSLQDKQYNQLDYYLTGAGVDSLPSLTARSLEGGEAGHGLNAVSSYLLLLSALEIYRIPHFSTRQNVTDETKRLMAEIKSLKMGGRLKLTDNSPKNRKRFFTWFEEEFFRAYKVVGGMPA